MIVACLVISHGDYRIFRDEVRKIKHPSRDVA